VIHARVLESKRRRLVELQNPLMAMIVLRYLGEAAALRELARLAGALETPLAPQGARVKGSARCPTFGATSSIGCLQARSPARGPCAPDTAIAAALTRPVTSQV
jgi:hypothetical protein